MLTDLRDEIDQIDWSILELLSKRAEVVTKIGTIKSQHHLPALQPKRKEELFQSRMQAAQEAWLDPAYIQEIWKVIHDWSIKSQRT